MRAVSSVKVSTRQDSHGRAVVTTEVKLWSKVPALKIAMEHLGLLKPTPEKGDEPDLSRLNMQDRAAYDRLLAKAKGIQSESIPDRIDRLTHSLDPGAFLEFLEGLKEAGLDDDQPEE